jgi:glutamate-1-semialdehyde 2,1-aminomutase
MAAGLATLGLLSEPECYADLEEASGSLADGLAERAADAAVPVAINRVGSMVGLFFVIHPGQPVTTFAEATAGDTHRYAQFFHAMLDRGVYLAPSMFEAMFVGTAHNETAIDQTLSAASAAFEAIAHSPRTQSLP